jgi:hypothetical protein
MYMVVLTGRTTRVPQAAAPSGIQRTPRSVLLTNFSPEVPLQPLVLAHQVFNDVLQGIVRSLWRVC